MSAPVRRRRELEIVAPAASPEEAAAIVAALERFIRDTAAPPSAAQPAPSAWTRAARLEGVGEAEPHPWR